MITRFEFLQSSVGGLRPCATAERSDRPRISLWHGALQKVGHLGVAQGDFNVLGHVSAWQFINRLTWSINDSEEYPLQFRAWRRLAQDGDFNADIPLAMIRVGGNKVRIRAYACEGGVVEEAMEVFRHSGSCPLPCRIQWRDLKDAQEAGQYVDGHWGIENGALRTRETGYDRLFLIGETWWDNYEAVVKLAVHRVDPATTPVSGGQGVGVLLRFAGHVTGGPRAFPSGQPKWGYQPFGGLTWLRWNRKQPSASPAIEFYPGDSDTPARYGNYNIRPKEWHILRARCENLQADETATGAARYSFKIWAEASEEPSGWQFEHLLESRTALRAGSLGLIAHHVDASFGDVIVKRLA